jgi:hypothetical protein
MFPPLVRYLKQTAHERYFQRHLETAEGSTLERSLIAIAMCDIQAQIAKECTLRGEGASPETERRNEG